MVVACGCRVFLHLPTLFCLPVSAFLSGVPGMIVCLVPPSLSLNLKASDPDGLASHWQFKVPKHGTFAFPDHGLGRAKVANQATKVRKITKPPRSLYESRGDTTGTVSPMAFTKWYQGVLDGSIRAKTGPMVPGALVALWPWSSKARNHHHLLN